MVRPNVLMLAKYFPPHNGGIESHTHDLVRSLSDRVNFTVIASGDSKSYTEESPFPNVRLIRLPTYFEIASLPFSPGIFRKLFSIDADLIHVHSPNPLFEVAALFKHGKPIVVTHHSDIIKQKRLKYFYYPVYRKLLKKSERILATSNTYAQSSDTISTYLSKVSVVGLGVAEDTCGVDCSLRPNLTNILPQDAKYLISVGRLVEYKGFEYLIRAAKHHSLHTVIVGDGPLKAKLNLLSAEMRLQDRVKILSNVDRSTLNRLYHHSELFVLPSVSKNEAFGIVQLEAMMHSKPLISCRIPGSGVSEVNVDQFTGFTVEPTNEVALGKAIHAIAVTPGLADSLGKNARTRVLSEYSNDKVSNRIFDVYQTILTSQRHS